MRDWINVITLLYEKALKESMVDKRIDETEADELKEIYNHYLDKRKGIMKSTQFEVEDVFSDIISEVSISPEQTTEPNSFLAQVM